MAAGEHNKTLSDNDITHANEESLNIRPQSSENNIDHSLHTSPSNSTSEIESTLGNPERIADLKKGAGGIRCLTWNMQSLFDKISLQGICDFIGTFDIICLCETFTLPSFDFSIKFEDFIPIHSPAEKFTTTGRPSGGLVTLIRKELEEFIQVIHTNVSHVICFKLKASILKTNKDLLYLCTYIHPSNSVFYTNKEYDNTLEMLENFLAEQLIKDDNVDVMLSGDLNARVGEWAYTHQVGDDENDDVEDIIYPRTAQDSQINPNGRKLIEICNAFNLTPLSGLTSKNFDNNFTFISNRGNSTIDHYVCSPDLLPCINNHKVLNRIESQHLPVTITIDSKSEHNTTKLNQSGSLKKFKWQPNKAHECTNIMNKPETEHFLQEANRQAGFNNIDSSVNSFTTFMQLISKPMEYVLQLGKRILDKPWFDKQCINSKKEVVNQLKKLNRINNKKQKGRYQKEKRKYLNLKLEHQKLVRDKRRAYNKQTKEKLIKESRDSRSFWALIKKLNWKKTKWPNITIGQWHDHYTHLFNPGNIPSDQGNTTSEETLTEVDELDHDITEQEVDQALQKLKKDKATGVDEVSAEILLHAKDKIHLYLCNIFNKIYETGYFPIQWGIATIIPLFKKGDRDLCDNYRGISLLSITSKVFTSVINNRLYNWAEENQKINEEQAGFRKSYSTIDHIYTLHSMASNCLFGSKRSKLYAAFIDFQKAFDSINRDRLWDILKKIGVSTRMINILKAMYVNVKAVVRQGLEKTQEIDCPLGVRQGCLLSPLLFSLLVAEIAYQVAGGGRAGYQMIPGAQEIFALLFADDVVLLSLTPIGLQTQLNNLKVAADSLGLTVNLNKSKVLVFRKGGYLGRLEHWKYGNQPMEVVNSYKYLGYTLTTKLSIEIPLSEFAGRAKHKVLTIFKTLFKLGKIETDTFFKLFDAQVAPMLIYASEVWGLASRETIQTIERVHMYACKRILGVTPRTPNTLIYGELNRFPLVIETQIRVLKYWAKVSRLDMNRIPRQTYEREKREINKPDNWALGVKRLLERNGYAFVWINEGTEWTKALFKSIKQTLIDQFWQNWHEEIQTNDRYDFYRTIKADHEKEPYIDAITITKFRRSLARFRLGITSLRNNDRFYNPLNPRDCTLCINKHKDDEEHFLLTCPYLTHLRAKYLLRSWITLCNVSVQELVANNNPMVIRNTALFIFHATKYRESFT